LKKISLIVYDFDGTLVDTFADIAGSVNLALTEMGLNPLDKKTIRGNIGSGMFNLMTRSLMKSGCNDIETSVLLFQKHYSHHLLDHTNFYPNGKEIVEYFFDKKNAILSNKPISFIEKILKALSFSKPFDSIIGGDSLDVKKPDPKGLLLMMNKFNCLPEKTLMVGDSAIDIETGKHAGVITCGVTYGLGNLDSLTNSNPDYLIDNLSQLKSLFN
jgi:2-phosphoglycolate phosphatase